MILTKFGCLVLSLFFLDSVSSHDTVTGSNDANEPYDPVLQVSTPRPTPRPSTRRPTLRPTTRKPTIVKPTTVKPTTRTPPTFKPLTVKPTTTPTRAPTTSTPLYCKCSTCTVAVWSTPVTDGAGKYTCGQRITWLQSAEGGSKSQYNSCKQVGEEFPNICGPACNPELCDIPTTFLTPAPTTMSPTTNIPSTTPTTIAPASASPTTSKQNITPSTSSPISVRPTTAMPSTSAPNTSAPTSVSLTTAPTSSTTESPFYCKCSTCNDAVWNTPVTDGAGTFTCGQRITWLQSAEGGTKSEYNSCKQVGVESNKCGPACNPELCDKVLNDPNPTDLVWSDEFNVDGLPDPSKWGYDLGDGCPNLCNWGNGEQAYFTKLPSNAFIANGKLSISAKKESGYSLPYTSARIVSRGLNTFKYGRIQFRANLAKCKARGTWPALWMLPERSVYGGWPNSGEIDVMETVGHEPDRFFGTVHTKLYNGMIGTQKGGVIGKSKDEWHTFEINWEQDRIQFAVDKQIYFEYLKEGASNTWPFDQDLHLIMNIAVGGTWGGAQGIDEAAFLGSGQIMEVDWIRVFNNTR